jgi:hypothetical protein
MRKAVTAAVAAAGFAALAANPFEGVWKVKDTAVRNHAVEWRRCKGLTRRRNDRHLEGRR